MVYTDLTVLLSAWICVNRKVTRDRLGVPVIGPWDSLEVPGNPWQFLEPPQTPCDSQALPATPCAPVFSRKDRPCLGNETNEKLAQGPSWPYGPHGLMRPLYTSSVNRRRLGLSPHRFFQRQDIGRRTLIEGRVMGGSSGDAIASVFSPTDSPRARRMPLDPQEILGTRWELRSTSSWGC